jgi:hypothetical protein
VYIQYYVFILYLHIHYLYISSMQNIRDNINLKWLKDPELDSDFDLIHYNKSVFRIKPIGIYTVQPGWYIYIFNISYIVII